MSVCGENDHLDVNRKLVQKAVTIHKLCYYFSDASDRRDVKIRVTHSAAIAQPQPMKRQLIKPKGNKLCGDCGLFHKDCWLKHACSIPKTDGSSH